MVWCDYCLLCLKRAPIKQGRFKMNLKKFLSILTVLFFIISCGTSHEGSEVNSAQKPVQKTETIENQQNNEKILGIFGNRGDRGEEKKRGMCKCLPGYITLVNICKADGSGTCTCKNSPLPPQTSTIVPGECKPVE